MTGQWSTLHLLCNLRFCVVKFLRRQLIYFFPLRELWFGTIVKKKKSLRIKGNWFRICKVWRLFILICGLELKHLESRKIRMRYVFINNLLQIFEFCWISLKFFIHWCILPHLWPGFFLSPCMMILSSFFHDRFLKLLIISLNWFSVFECVWEVAVSSYYLNSSLSQ
jgi:hypothetical protein